MEAVAILRQEHHSFAYPSSIFYILLCTGTINTHTIPIPHKASVEQQDENAPQHRTERLLSETRAAVSGEQLCIELAKRSMLDIELGKRSMC